MSERIYEQVATIRQDACFECDGPAEHRHHVVPESCGGRRVVWLCENCHEKAHGFREGHFAKMRARRKEVAAQGGYVGSGGRRRKYGLGLKQDRRGKWRWVPVLHEQVVIRRICDTCPNGEGYAELAKQLNLEKIPTVTGVPWSKNMVRAIARRGPDKFPDKRLFKP